LVSQAKDVSAEGDLKCGGGVLGDDGAGVMARSAQQFARVLVRSGSGFSSRLTAAVVTATKPAHPTNRCSSVVGALVRNQASIRSLAVVDVVWHLDIVPPDLG
jgi:hypothetical protein